MASTQSKRYSKNNICLSTEKVSELKNKDMAYKWNISKWKWGNSEKSELNKIAESLKSFVNKHSSSNVDNKDLMQVFLEYLLDVFEVKNEDENSTSENKKSFLNSILIEGQGSSNSQANQISQRKGK